jgi:hypothetical protein
MLARSTALRSMRIVLARLATPIIRIASKPLVSRAGSRIVSSAA